MKIITAFLVNLVVIFSLCACGYNFEVIDKSVDFNAQYIRTGAYAEVSYPIVAVLKSKNNLDDYYNNNKTVFNLERKSIEAGYTGQTIGFLDAVDNYNEDFFENNFLILIVLEEPSGSITHKINKTFITTDDKCRIEIETACPDFCSDDMEYWHILIEISKENAPKNYKDIELIKDNEHIKIENWYAF